MMTTKDTPKPLTAVDGAALIQLLDELASRAWPLGSMADNVYLHYHADGVWRVRTGYMLPEHYAEWQQEDCPYPTLTAALEAALQAYRAFDNGEED